MASQITNYKCPACTGPLHYSGGSGRLECDYCGSSYSVEEIEKLYAEKDKKAAEAKAAEDQKQEEEKKKAEAEAKAAAEAEVLTDEEEETPQKP